MNAIHCHMCESETDFTCRDCEEPVCEDCCVVPTIHNQIEYALCKSCEIGRELARSIEANREWDLSEQKRIKREAANAKRKATYWKPKNIEKRKTAKAKRNAERVERNKKLLAETFRIVNSMMGS